MPRFPTAFNRRKSAADNLDNAPVTGPSFRVLDRAEVVSGTKNFDAGNNSRLTVKISQSMPNTLMAADPEDDNIFANLNGTHDSDLSNTAKTVSTENPSRHSNVSTAPSSADFNTQQKQQQQYNQYLHQQQQEEDWKLQNKKQYGDVPVPPIPKSNTTSSFLKSAGRTFSFGGQKKHLPNLPDERPPQTPPTHNDSNYGNRDRAMTASTVTTATPPKLEEEFTFDLGGDFGKMLGGFDKRASVATLRNDDSGRPALLPRSLTENRLNQSNPIQYDNITKVIPSPYSRGSQNSNDQLLYSNSLAATPNENAPPVPRHGSPPGTMSQVSGATTVPALNSVPPTSSSTDSGGLKRASAIFGRRRSTIAYAAETEDEDTVLLKDSLFTVNRFLAGSSLSNTKTSAPNNRAGRRNNENDTSYHQVPTESTSPIIGADPVGENDDNMFDTTLVHSSRTAQRFVAKQHSPPRNKVMTPAQFERYRKDKERENGNAVYETKKAVDDEDDEDDNYEDDIDEAEKSRQAVKQRRKQEAHMTVYRQQMMKVTGEAASGTPARSNIQFSMSTPNLSVQGTTNGGPVAMSPHAGPDNEEEDEEVPLAILAAHGFPNRNRPPTRLSTMMSNPNLRAAATPSYQRPQSIVGGDAPASVAGGNSGRLPVFARNLPQDPYGLVNSNNRETLNYAGGVPASQASNGALPPGGLIGVIASEERSRAMRRGSPALDAINKPLPNMATGMQFDPTVGIPSQLMYPGTGQPRSMLTPGDQAQIQMSQQMQQFMQMQMQFMQMMTASGANGTNGVQRPSSQYGGSGGAPINMGMGSMPNPDIMRHSFADNSSIMDMQPPHPDMHTRTMSMVQPSSVSWIQQQNGYAPSIRIQGVNGYAPSIAPSERSNVGLPGRYRPVSHVPPDPSPSELHKSLAASGALGYPMIQGQTGANVSTSPNSSGSASPNENNLTDGRGQSPTGWDLSRKQKSSSPLNKQRAADDDDDDDDEGWAAMKAKRDKKRSLWKSKKTFSTEIGALVI